MISDILLLQVVVVGAMITLASIFCNIDISLLSGDELSSRMYKISPYVALLALIYVFNQSSHTVGQQLSALIGTNITGHLHTLEGDFVATIQGIIPDSFAGYFTFMYIFGFAFVLVFPIIAYFVLPSRRYLTELFVAYTINYGGGAICYLLFIAYGPRNVADHVDAPMYDLYPQTAELTGSVNSSANVFPSLHVSLTVTVVLLAWRTRTMYPRWLWIATFLTANISISTMYLGIHWLIDVITGIGLAIISVLVALRAVTQLEDAASESEFGISDEEV